MEKNKVKKYFPIIIGILFLLAYSATFNQNKKGEVIKLNYYIYAENGKLIETNDPNVIENNTILNSKTTFLLGYKQFPPNIEERMLQTVPGDFIQVKLKPTEAYGEYKKNLNYSVNTLEVEKEIGQKPYVGLIVYINTFRINITQVDYDGNSTLDANIQHAGEEILYKAKIIEITKTKITEKQEITKN